MKNVSGFGRRLASAFGLIILVALTGCAGMVSIDKARMGMLVTHVVSPGADGMSTSETIRCRFKGAPISPELAQKYYENPAQAFIDKACEGVDESKVVVQGAPTLAGQMTASGMNALTGGLVSYSIQNRLQRQQQEFCLRTGSCGNRTVITNNNNSDAAATSQQSMDTKVEVTAPCQNTNTCGQ